MKFFILILVMLNNFCLGIAEPVGKYAVVVFDFGGVVGGTDKAAVAKGLALLLNIPFQDVELLAQELSSAKENGIPRDVFWSEFEKKTGKILPDNWDDYYEKTKLVAIRPNLRMLDLAKKLKNQGYRVAMLSNVSSERARYIRKLGVYNSFDPVVLSCEINAVKPDPRAFKILLAQLKTSPEECIFIDNAPENLEMARNLGFETIPFSTVEQLEKDLAAHGII